MDTNSLAHTKWECKYHIVFAAVKNKIRKLTVSHPDSTLLWLNHNNGKIQMSYLHSMSMIDHSLCFCGYFPDST